MWTEHTEKETFIFGLLDTEATGKRGSINYERCVWFWPSTEHYTGILLALSSVTPNVKRILKDNGGHLNIFYLIRHLILMYY